MLPMTLTLSAPPPRRLRQLLVLLLLALGLLAGVSVSQTHALESRASRADVVLLPALQRLHELAGRVDEQRGMAALHLTLRSDAERIDLEGRLQAGRAQIERRMAALAQRLADDGARRHHQAVVASLAVFWELQDRLLAASRRAATDPAAAGQARALLTGEAQQAYHRLRADIEAWWSHTEQSAALLAQQVHTAAHLVAQLVWAQAALVALALAMAWALLQAPVRPFAAGVATGPALDGPAVQAGLQLHLQALNAAVAAARRGEPGRAAGLSAAEAQRLAEQVAGAAQGLRRLILQPPVARSSAWPDSRGDDPAPPR
jgi:hypothetical protein